jgi:hypothetical protein
MSFESYESARPWARAIREETLERRMPPTGLRSGTMLYENARALSLGEMELLAAWVDGGAPTGEEPWLATASATPPPQPLVEPPADPITWDREIAGRAVPGNGDPLSHAVQFSVPDDWIAGWMLDAGGVVARSARLMLADGSALGTWTPDERPVRFPDDSGVRVERNATITAHFTLAFAADEAERGQWTPRLMILSATGARRRVTHRTIREASSAVTDGTSLLALRLELGDPEASAEVIVERANGDRDFLMAMAPPGVPDPISYRLRAPLVLAGGDRLRVDSTVPFVLDVEETQAVTGGRTRR